MRLRATYRSPRFYVKVSIRPTVGLNIGGLQVLHAADSSVRIRGIGSANDGADIFELCSCVCWKHQREARSEAPKITSLYVTSWFYPKHWSWGTSPTRQTRMCLERARCRAEAGRGQRLQGFGYWESEWLPIFGQIQGGGGTFHLMFLF